MSKCDSYYLQPEQHYFVDKYGAPVYENINVPRCWGTKEKEWTDLHTSNLLLIDAAANTDVLFYKDLILKLGKVKGEIDLSPKI